MPKIDPAIIHKRFWWYRFWQYLVALLLFVSVPIAVVYLTWIFQMPKQIYYMAGGFCLVQIIMLYLSPRWVLSMIASFPDKYQKVTPETQPRFYAKLDKLAQKSNFAMPDVYIVDSETANAFALKIFGSTYIACITKKLMEILTEDEAEAVMAHEFGHIANDDVKLTMYVAVFNILVQVINKHIVDLIIQRGLEKSEELIASGSTAKSSIAPMLEKGGFLAIFGSISIAYKILTYFPYFVAILFARIMQQKEYRADAHAVYILEETATLKSGLAKLQKYAQRLPMFPAALNPLFAVPVGYHFFLWPLVFIFPSLKDSDDAMQEPGWGERLRNLMESHPLVYDRIKRMESYEV